MTLGPQHSAYLPVKQRLGRLYAISCLIAGLMAMGSLAGLLYPTVVYPSNDLRQAFMPNDVVDLMIGLPALLVSVWLARIGRVIGLFLWPGALLYVLYTHLVYLLAMPLSPVLLIHLVLVTSSAYALVALVASIDATAVQDRLAESVPARASGAILVCLGVLFLLRAIAVLCGAVLSHSPLDAAELALNLADFMITPTWVIGGCLLWRRQALGYASGLGLLFQASMLFIGLSCVLIVRPFVSPGHFAPGDVLVVLLLGAVCFVPFGLYVRGVTSRPSPGSKEPGALK